MPYPFARIVRMHHRGSSFQSGAFQAAPSTPGGAAAIDFGALPQWRLDDLYEGMDSPKFAEDLSRAAADAKRFASAYQGNLVDLAKAPDAGERLYEAVRAYEALQDLMGRIMSYASL